MKLKLQMASADVRDDPYWTVRFISSAADSFSELEVRMHKNSPFLKQFRHPSGIPNFEVRAEVGVASGR